MALQVSTTFKGLVVPAAYVAVVTTGTSRLKDEQFFTVTVRASQTDEVLTAVDYCAYYDLEGDNPFVQAYRYLKGLPEYAGAIDC